MKKRPLTRSFPLSAEEERLIKKAAKAQSVSFSEFIRTAALSYQENQRRLALLENQQQMEAVKKLLRLVTVKQQDQEQESQGETV